VNPIISGGQNMLYLFSGKKYYFCAVGCKKAFDQNLEKYLAEEKK